MIPSLSVYPTMSCQSNFLHTLSTQRIDLSTFHVAVLDVRSSLLPPHMDWQPIQLAAFMMTYPCSAHPTHYRLWLNLLQSLTTPRPITMSTPTIDNRFHASYMFTVRLSKWCPHPSFNSVVIGPSSPPLRTLFLWFITPSLLLSLWPHTPPRHFRLPLGPWITPPMLCMTCHVTRSLSMSSLTLYPRTHHPSHPRQTAIVLHAQQDLHPPLGTLRRSPNLSGGRISHAGHPTTSGRTHALHSIHRLSCTLRYDSYCCDNC